MKEIGLHGTSKVLKWKLEDSNIDLDRSFTGIEKFLSIDLIHEAEKQGIMKTLRPSGNKYPLIAVKDNLNKKRLAQLAESRQNPDDFNYFKSLLVTLDSELRDSLFQADRIMSGTLFELEEEGRAREGTSAKKRGFFY
jgi:hypothetical protein